jgi:hypothetical protein
MACDIRGHRTILFGGADNRRGRSDTWIWDHDRRDWQAHGTSGPAARTFPAMAYDAAGDEIVLLAATTATGCSATRGSSTEPAGSTRSRLRLS